MLVESNDKEGAEVYEMIIKQIFQDIQLSPSVKDLRAYVNPDEVVFIMAVLMNKTTSSSSLSDFAQIKFLKTDNQTRIEIKDENQLPNILNVLWKVKGRENVHQPDRFSILLDGNHNDLNDLIVDDPHLNLQKRIYDAIYRIVPEGFKNIKDISQGEIIAVVATDELIKDAWLEKGNEYIQELIEDNKVVMP